MIDPDTFDRCNENEDAIEATQKKHHKNLMRLMAATLAIKATLGNDFIDDMDWEDFSDEEFNC